MPPSASSPIPDPSAALLVMADHLERYEEQVSTYLPAYLADDHGDIASALVESERALRTAARLLRRAAKVAGNTTR